MNNKNIYVTQPFLAPLEEYTDLLKGVWESGILTHNGPLVQQFERDFCKAFDVQHFVAVTSGTIALQIAIKALKLKGEIITTPFTWIATASAIIWENCTPVFCDIEPDTLNMDPARIEALITDKTVAILPVHVFGNPCDVMAIDKIARNAGLKVIYDAAHAIGSTLDGKSILEYGDVSATSLHGTKLLNTAEGGGCVTRDPSLYEKIKRIRFFGHDDNKDIVEDGLNGKMTEVHAAMGIANIKYINMVLNDRRDKYSYYTEHLSGSGNFQFQLHKVGESNCSYFPLIFDSETSLIAMMDKLKEINIFPRRYFYPSVNTYEKIVAYQKAAISEEISRKILCLPLYYDLPYEDMDRIIDCLVDN